jgi:hypothetical protein
MTEYDYFGPIGQGNDCLDSFNFDDPTPEETDLQRMTMEGKKAEPLDEEDKAEWNEVQYSEYMRLSKAEDYLRASCNAKTAKERANWLKDIGYDSVNVKNHTKPLDLDDAVREWYNRNIHGMFIREIRELKRISIESRKYLEKTGFFKKSKN